ncbi:MAG TPA: ABC transporter permease [Longimicrobiales bacterium]|nr:ABC transporter permease [Longimicrobiales bacterium]
MSRTWAIVKREFGESVRSRMFIIGTLFGPLLMFGLGAFQVAMLRGGGGEKAVVVVDGSGAGVGQTVARLLETVPPGDDASRATRFHAEVVAAPAGGLEALRPGLESRIDRKEIDGYLWLPAGMLAGDTARYAGKSATNTLLVAQMRRAVQGAVQSARLAGQGIDPGRLAVALRPVPLETSKAGSGTARGSGQALYFLGYILGFIVYFSVLLFGAAVMRGVLEEKKDRIVEVVVSSVRAGQLMLGKVVGIGGAGLLQMTVWVVFAAIGLKYGDAIMTRFGLPALHPPQVPGSVAVAFLAYFAGGFFLYASMYAALGAMAASDQDMQQLQFPVVLCLMMSFFLMFRALADPESNVARLASWFPLSSPMVMPIRSALTHLSPLEIAGSYAALIGTALAVVWVGGRIYRIGILATGQRPTPAEVVRWIRTS